MIIIRYVMREVLLTTLVISLVLFLLTFGSRFAKYLEEAWQGRIMAEVVFTILGFRIPELFMFILPISFFIAVIISYGRLYADNEMVVLSSCGVSKGRLLFIALVPAAIMSVLVAFLTLYLGPAGLAKADAIQIQQKTRSGLSILSPNRLQTLSNGRYEIYFDRFANDQRTVIENVFIAEMNPVGTESDRLEVMTAASGRQITDRNSGQQFLLLRDVYQYSGKPGFPDYEVGHPDEYGIAFDQSVNRVRRSQSVESMDSTVLLNSDQPAMRAELHWRLAFPILIIVATLIAVPMSYTDPRKGRYFKLFPALLLIIGYLALLIVGKSRLESGTLPPALGLWWAHGIYLLIAAALLLWNNGQYLGNWKRSMMARVAAGKIPVENKDAQA